MEDFGTLTSGLTVQAVHGSGEGGFGIESRGPVGFQVVARDTTVSDKFARIDVGGQRDNDTDSCTFWGMTIPSQ